MTNISDLFNLWQASIEKAQSAKQELSEAEELEQDQLVEVEGIHIRSGVLAGQLFSLLTLCRCED